MWQLYNLEEQYAQNPEIEREEVLKLVKWIESQPHLPNITEHEALQFFAVSNCSMETAKKLVDVNMSCRTHFTEFFDDYDVKTPRMLKARQTSALFLLPKRTPEGCAVFLGKLINPDASNFNFIDSLKLYFIQQDIFLKEIGLVKDYLLVIDLTDATFAHLARAGIMQLKKLLYYLQEAIPLHLASVHFINLAPFIDKLMALMTPFLNKEAKEKIKVHSNIETFYQIVPKELLPQEMGGHEAPSTVLCENMYKRFDECRFELMEYNSSRKINEKLRPHQMKQPSDIFGTEGNFKKLDID